MIYISTENPITHVTAFKTTLESAEQRNWRSSSSSPRILLYSSPPTDIVRVRGNPPGKSLSSLEVRKLVDDGCSCNPVTLINFVCRPRFIDTIDSWEDYVHLFLGSRSYLSEFIGPMSCEREQYFVVTKIKMHLVSFFIFVITACNIIHPPNTNQNKQRGREYF